MDKCALAYRLLSKGHYVEVVILAYRRVKVELAFQLVFFHHLVVIFVTDFIVFQESVAFVALCILAHITRILRLDPREVHDLSLLLFSVTISTYFAS